jgi:ABC-type branched-subunit amino acid transport system ATPase component
VSAALLAVEGVVAGYRPDLPIVRDMSIGVSEGELVTIIGPNGAGKSTLVKAIAGLVRVSAGRVALAGRDITNIETHRMAQARVAYVPQSANVFTTLTIEDNLKVGGTSLAKADLPARIAAAYEAFPDLAPYRRDRAGVLSGGQRQMLAIARALVTRPRLLMLDEPSAGLAPAMVGGVFKRLKSLVEDGIAILMVEQNARAAMQISQRTYVLAEGRNRLEGASADLLADPEVIATYLGTGRRG